MNKMEGPWQVRCRSLVSFHVFLAGLASFSLNVGWWRGEAFTPTGPAAGAVVSEANHGQSGTRADNQGRFTLSRTGIGPLIVAYDGYYLASSQGGMVPLQPMPADHPETPWLDATPGTSAQACGNCHLQHFEQWRASPHNLSAESSLLQAVLAAPHRGDQKWNLRSQHPDAVASCAACHSPGSGLEVLIGSDLPNNGQLSGVHCDFCHKVRALGSGKPGLTHGRDLFELVRPAQGGRPVVIGPLPDSTRANVAYSGLFKSSLFCAPCHEGTVLGAHVYSSFSEWQAWGGNQSCQGCHMPIDKPREHHHGMTAKLARQSGGLRHSLSLSKTSSGVNIRLELWTDGVGHALPTGHVDRHLLALLEARDNNGSLLGPSLGGGERVPAWAMNEGHESPGVLLGRWQENLDEVPLPFWRAGGTWHDTRLFPGKKRIFNWDFPANAIEIRLLVEHRKAWPATLREYALIKEGEKIVDSLIKIPE